MSQPRKYVSDFDNARRLAFIRSRSQAWFRNEEWLLTWEEFQVFWNTQRRWNRRSRDSNGLTMTRLDWSGPWSKDNCCIITRKLHLSASAKRKVGRPYEECFEGAILYGQ